MSTKRKIRLSDARRFALHALVPCVVLSAVAGCGSPEDSPSSSREPGSEAPSSFVERQLSNGMRLIVGERRGSGLVASSVLVRAGAVWETSELNGAAHFLEHLLFNGTENRTQEQLYADVDRLGAYNNASTRKDYAIFMFLVGADSLDAGLEIHADMLFHSTLPPDKFEKEKGIVLEEIAKDHSKPDYARGVVMDEVLYAGSSYAMPVLGTDASIRGLERDAVLAYYHEHYTPGNTTVLLIGDMPIEEMIAAAERTYGAVPAANGESGEQPAAPPVVDGWRRVHAPVDSDMRTVRLRLNGPEPGSEDVPAFELLSAVLANGRGARLARAMRIEPAIEAPEVYAGLTFVGGRSYFDVSARVPITMDVDQVAARMAGELQRLTDENVDESELAAARVGFRAEEASLREKIHYYGMMRSEHILNFPTRYLSEQLDRHRETTPAKVRAAAERWLDAPPALVVAVGPELTPRDERVEAQALGFTVPVRDLPGADAPDVVDVRRAPPRARAATAPHLVELSNGLRVILSTDPSSNVLAMHLMAMGRSFREPDGQAGITDFVHRMLTRGAGDSDAASFGARLAAIGASVKTHDSAAIPYDDYYTSPTFSFVRFETLDDYFDESVGLLGEMVTQPRFDDAEIERVREEMLQIAENAEESPVERARALFLRALYGEESPAAKPIHGTEESLRAIDREALLAYHHTYFAPENLVLAVVTGLPESVVLEGLEAHVTFPARGSEDAGVDPWSPRDASPPVTASPTKLEEEVGKPQSGVSLGYAFDFAPEDRASLDVATLILSDRMAFHLRERLGLAYSIGASFSSWGNRGILTAGMGTRPENVDVAVAGLAEQIDSLAVVRMDDGVLQTVVNARVGRMRMRRITRMGQAYYLCMDVLHGEPLGAHDERLTAMRAVRPESVAQVAATYFDADRANRAIVR